MLTTAELKAAKEAGLSEEEAEVAAGMGLSWAQYAANKKPPVDPAEEAKDGRRILEAMTRPGLLGPDERREVRRRLGLPVEDKP